MCARDNACRTLACSGRAGGKNEGDTNVLGDLPIGRWGCALQQTTGSVCCKGVGGEGWRQCESEVCRMSCGPSWIVAVERSRTNIRRGLFMSKQATTFIILVHQRTRTSRYIKNSNKTTHTFAN